MSVSIRPTSGKRQVETQWDRIEKARQKAGVSLRAMAMGVGKSHSAHRHWVGKDDLPKELLVDLARYFTDKCGVQTSWEWLREGDRSKSPRPLDWIMLRDVMRAIVVVCEEDNLPLSEDAGYELASVLYPVFEQSGEIDMDWVRAQVRLTSNRLPG